MSNRTDSRSSRAPWPWATIIVGVAALVVDLVSRAPDGLGYDRDRILNGEWWRLVTCHWVHFSGSHLFWNLAVLVPAGIWAERIDPVRTRWLYFTAPIVIGAALFVFDPSLLRYAGLSGVATAVLVFLALLGWRGAHNRWVWAAVLVLVVVKVAMEWSGAPLFARFDDERIRAVPFAHVAGAACAVPWAALKRRASQVPR